MVFSVALLSSVPLRLAAPRAAWMVSELPPAISLAETTADAGTVNWIVSGEVTWVGLGLGLGLGLGSGSGSGSGLRLRLRLRLA
jgi:hypothetical protein